ncbi:MAG: cytochrome c biogenesis protein ResB [Candidatus Eremiobacteraeota bacterium]|nr:cytochrome c biogenesis protein ResB [Candidatus Eremiobacteraeota bacterium]
MAVTQRGVRTDAAAISPLREFYDAALGRLSDFWFGMFLLAVWGVMTVIGVIVDQGKDRAFYQTNYAAPLARLVLRLHLDNIYHSPAYLGIIGLILACMTLATFRRVIPKRLPPLRPVKIAAIPLNATVTVYGDETAVRERVERFFAGRGWLVRNRELGGTEWTFADKHNWARRGVLVAHVGFVIIAFGTLLYWALGYSGQTTIVSGNAVTIPQNGTRLRLDRFAYRIDPIRTRSGVVFQPIDYVSTLEVTPQGGSMQRRVLRVNHPLDIGGTNYYQASYGFAVPFTVTRNGRPLADVPTAPLKEGDAFALGDTARSLQYARFIGTIGPNDTIGADPRPHNPGVVLDLFDGDQNIGSVLVPLGGGIDLGAGYRVAVGPYVLYSGIQYRHDPGIPFVLAGAFVLLAGLCMSFYFLPARFYVRIDGAASQWDVGIAATTVKGYDIYEEQFADLISEFANTGPPGAPAAAHAMAIAPA